MSNNKIVKQTDWQNLPMPEEHKVLPCKQTFNPVEYVKLQDGYLPEVMEDKWFIYFKNNKLYCHRSWTGYCYYIVEFEVCGDSYQIANIVVNRNSEQCSETDDLWDMEFVVYVINLLLLRKPASYPQKKGIDPANTALQQWGHVDRAMLGDVDKQ